MRFLLLILSSFTVLGCAATTKNTVYDFDSIRQITESSSSFHYSSYSYEFSLERSHGIKSSVAHSNDKVIVIETDKDMHHVSINLDAIKRNLLRTDLERDLLESPNLLVLDTGRNFEYKKNANEITFSTAFGTLNADYLVLISGSKYQSAIYLPLPSKICIESTHNVPTSCNFDTDECGFFYAGLLTAGKTLDPNFNFPSNNLACNIDPTEQKMFYKESAFQMSIDAECEGMIQIECMFYQR
ncbi:hypothetical protein AAFX30_08260 [Vibrio chagasii]|uniref:hypothetical protein n=1 Tax=Vibrio chagasii TaxID=170679 RepID=UPI0038CD5480